MNAMDIMTGLNGVRDSYVADAGEFRQGKQKPAGLPKRRMWLIAAIVALTLLLVGCAALYVLRLQDMAFGEDLVETPQGGVETWSKLSLQGVKGTPGYNAVREWYEWLQSYDPDDAIYHSDEAFSEDFGDAYYAYNIYTREMKDKLDEICGKYHLNLLGKMYFDPDEAAACKALGIQGILRPGIPAETDFGGMRYYADGSFTVEGTVALTETVWPYEELLSFSCARKDSFSDVYAAVGPEGSYEEWNYRTSYGADVLIVQEKKNGSGHHAFIIADQADFVFFLNMNEYDREWTKEGLESYAEAFDFTLQPQRVSQQALAEAEERKDAYDEEWAAQYSKRARSYTELGYDSRIKSRMEFSTHPSQLGFAVMDLDGDGVEELIVGENGYIIAVYSKIDGGTQYLMPPVFAFEGMIEESFSYLNRIGVGTSAGYSYIYLCKDNVLAYVSVTTQGEINYSFAKPENGKYVWDNAVHYTPRNQDNPWNLYQDLSAPIVAVPITQEQFEAIVQSHPQVLIELTPITQYPLADSSPSGIGAPDDVYTSYGALLAGLFAPENWQYCRIDLDGDGQDELFLTQGAWKGVLTMKDGQVKILECGENLQICKGNYIAYTRKYADGNSAVSFYRVENGKTVLADYLRYDAGKDPDSPWFYSVDGQDDTLRPISQEKYDSILAKYTPMELEMAPVSEYHVS